LTIRSYKNTQNRVQVGFGSFGYFVRAKAYRIGGLARGLSGWIKEFDGPRKVQRLASLVFERLCRGIAPRICS